MPMPTITQPMEATLRRLVASLTANEEHPRVDEQHATSSSLEHVSIAQSGEPRIERHVAVTTEEDAEDPRERVDASAREQPGELWASWQLPLAPRQPGLGHFTSAQLAHSPNGTPPMLRQLRGRISSRQPSGRQQAVSLPVSSRHGPTASPCARGTRSSPTS